MKIAIYSRKSKFTGKGESIENQIELCRQYIASKYKEVRDEDIIIYEDEGFSGGNTNRPQFKKMIEAAKNHEFNYVICYKLDRITRNVSDFANLNEQLQKLGISFVSIKEEFDMSTSMGRAMMIIVSVFSQLERETIAERIRDNMHELAKTGRWLGGNTPTGYESEQIEKIAIDGKVRRSCKLKLVEDQADIVRLIYDKYLESNSLTIVETFLLKNYIKTKKGNDFTRFSIKGILQNPVYMIADNETWTYFSEKGVEISSNEIDFDAKHGIMAYNKTAQKQGKKNEMRDLKDWIIAVGKHKGIISGSDWVNVQNKLLQNKTKKYHRTNNSSALLSGTLCCNNCGDYMRPKLSGKENKHGEKLFSYLCQTKERSHMHNCAIKNPSGNMLDEAVCKEIKKLQGDNLELVKLLKGWIPAIKSGSAKENEADIMKRKINENERDISALVNALAKAEGTPASDYISKRINELHEMNGKIEQNITKTNNSFEARESKGEDVHTSLISWADAFEQMNTSWKKGAIKRLIQRVVWDGEDAHITFHSTN